MKNEQAQVTSHWELARQILNDRSHEEAEKLIADSEARAVAELRAARDSDFEVFHAMRMKLTAACGDPYKLHDEALDAIIAERDQLRAEVKRLDAEKPWLREANETVAQLRAEVKRLDAEKPWLREANETVAQLRAEVERLKCQAQQEKEHHEFYRGKVSDYMGAELAWVARAERAEAELASIKRGHGELGRYEQLRLKNAELVAELAKERARKNWLNTVAGMDWMSHIAYGDMNDAAIDQAMKEESK